MDFLSFFVGLWVGGIVGVIVMALMRAGRDPKTRDASPAAGNAPVPDTPATGFEPAEDPK